MIPQYDKLTANLDLIRRYLESGVRERQTTDQRRFSYIACISALYASFESFAEHVAFRFSQLLLAHPNNFSTDQIEKLRRRYVQNASSLLTKGLGAGRYSDVTELEVATSLASCLDDSTSFDLRMEVVAMHSSNLRWDSFGDLFRWAVPDLPAKIRLSDAISEWGSADGGQVFADVLEAELEDLVERRNEVAHRAIPDEIVSPEQLLAKVEFINAIALGLLASLGGELLQASLDNGESVPVGVPKEYYQQCRVVVVPSLEISVAEGDIVWITNSNVTRWGRIQEIRLNDERVSQADAGTEAGLLLGFAAPRGLCLHIWQNPNPDLAPPPPGIFGRRGPLSAI